MADQYNSPVTISSSRFFNAINNWAGINYYGESLQDANNNLNSNGASVKDWLAYNGLQATFNGNKSKNLCSTYDTILDTGILLTGLNLSKTVANSNAATQATVTLAKNPVAAASTASGLSMTSIGNFFMGTVVPAATAVAIAPTLGVTIDGAAYNIMEALGEHPPYYMNPDNWANICKDDDSLGMQAFCLLTGIDTSTAKAQNYVQEDVYATMAYWTSTQGWYDDSYNAEDTVTPEQKAIIDPADRIFNPIHLTNNLLITDVGDPPTVSQLVCNSDIGMWITEASNSDSPLLPFPEAGARRVWAVGTRPFTVTLSVNGGSPSQQNSQQGTFYDNITGELVTFHYINQVATGQYRAMKTSSLPYRINKGYSSLDTINQLVMQYYLHGTYVPTGDRPEGVTSQPAATLPDTSTWADPQSTLISLQNQYPEYFDPNYQAKVIPTLQEDGTIENVTWVPISFVQPVININDNSERTYSLSSYGTQSDSSVPMSDDDKMTNQLLTSILNQIKSWDPYVAKDDNFVEDKEEEDEEEELKEPEEDKTKLTVGTGRSPTIAAQINTPTKLFRVYHLSEANVNDFGNWLWDKNILAALRDLLQDPLEPVISLHQIYIQPIVTGSAHITVGKIDSLITADVVSQLFSTKSAGTVQCMERFGNVFDYPPYTSVQIFLPFIGIKPLNVADVMRSLITVTYSVEIITGNFLATITVTRDGQDVDMYQYSGNMSAQYPISHMSYLNMYSTAVSIVTTAAATSALLGMGAAVKEPAMRSARTAISGANSAINSLSGLGLTYERTGSITGNIGAMGGKRPYLIITRPQIAMSPFDDDFHGIPSNQIVTLSKCTGFTTVKEVRLKLQGATNEEYNECETLLKNGVIF